MKMKVEHRFRCPICFRAYDTKEKAEKCLKNCTENYIPIYYLALFYDILEGTYSIDIFSYRLKVEEAEEDLHTVQCKMHLNRVKYQVASEKMNKRIAAKLISQGKKHIAKMLLNSRKHLLGIKTKFILGHAELPDNKLKKDK